MTVDFARVMSEPMHDYHVARHADELAREASDLGYATERAMQKADGGRQPITYRQWLVQARRPAPSPDEETDVAWRAAFDALAIFEEADKAVREATALRNAEVAALVALGLSYAAIGARLGVSKQCVGAYVAAHRKTTTRRRTR